MQTFHHQKVLTVSAVKSNKLGKAQLTRKSVHDASFHEQVVGALRRDLYSNISAPFVLLSQICRKVDSAKATRSQSANGSGDQLKARLRENAVRGHHEEQLQPDPHHSSLSMFRRHPCVVPPPPVDVRPVVHSHPPFRGNGTYPLRVPSACPRGKLDVDGQQTRRARVHLEPRWNGFLCPWTLKIKQRGTDRIHVVNVVCEQRLHAKLPLHGSCIARQ
mmetsp:Transcript_65267/g.173052  ORF Transcript_65267/g.173052 Transcript_65267/m.173052 type:complete len:218 (-) Transcript_65267:200-853(-)